MHMNIEQSMALTPEEQEKIARETDAVRVREILAQNLVRSGFQPDFGGEESEKRKEKLARIAEHFPALAEKILQRFQSLAEEAGLHPGKLTLFVVGGRIRAIPLSDNTDYDIVITAENPLNPFGRKDAPVTVTFPQRHALARAVYESMEGIFNELGLGADYERGIIEIKGLGERTAEQVSHEESTLKVMEWE